MEINYSNRTEFFKHVMIDEVEGALVLATGAEPLGATVSITDRTDFYSRIKFDENGNLLVKVIGGSPEPPSGDVDATAYLAAITSLGGTVDTTITTATNNLFTSLKTAGLYTKVKRLYPMIGSTKDACSLEAKLTTKDILWNNSTGFTFTSNGIFCNGVNIRPAAYINETPYQIFGSGNNNISFSLYNRTSRGPAANFCVVASVGGDNNYFQLSLNYDGNNYTAIGKAFLTTPALTTQGLFTISRTSDTSQKLYVNSVSQGELTTPGSTLASSTQIGLFDMSEDNYSFFSLNDGLDATEAATYYTIVQTFQTELGRAV